MGLLKVLEKMGSHSNSSYCFLIVDCVLNTVLHTLHSFFLILKTTLRSKSY